MFSGNGDYEKSVSEPGSFEMANEDLPRQAAKLDFYSFPTHQIQTTMTNPSRTPLVLVACGSFSPITYLHLRIFEMALDKLKDSDEYEVVAGYYSPVSDSYKKSGLAPCRHRVRMCELACQKTSKWLMVDAWECLQPGFTRTAKVLDHFDYELNRNGGVMFADGIRRKCRIMLLAGSDLIESMGEPGVWADSDLHHLLLSFGLLIVERTGSDVRNFLLSHDIMYKHRKKIIIIKQLIYNDISSTKIRLFVRRGMSVRYLLPNSIIAYIEANKLYLGPEPVVETMAEKRAL